MKVGFVGLGIMGQGMATQLIKAGHEVWVWNRSPRAMEPLVAQGAHAAADLGSLLAGVEVVHSMLANDQAVRQVWLNDTALAGLRGKIHVNHATISIELVRELATAHAAQQAGYVAAPVFGRPDVAAAGRLNILVAGAPEAVALVRPLLEVMSAKVWPFGDVPERASITKIAGNLMLASAIGSMAEASTLTRAYGVSAADFLDVMTRTLFAAPAYQGYGKMIAEDHYQPAGFAMSLGYKDVGLGLAAASAEKVPMPIAGVLRDALLEALAAGDGELDWAALAKVAAARAHLQDRRKS
ncbi:NAD(P)-dependent oxidoreductase [Frateuria aurantia]